MMKPDAPGCASARLRVNKDVGCAPTVHLATVRDAAGANAGTLAAHHHGCRGVPSAPLREECGVCMCATGADDDRTARKPGRSAVVRTAS